jgi:hypothetical protein
MKEQEELTHDLRREFREAARTASERPDSFWERQRVAVRQRIESSRARRLSIRRWTWAAASAAAALVLALAVWRRPPAPAPRDPDHELLVAVERSLEREVPAALAPAVLLAGELSRAAEPKDRR